MPNKKIIIVVGIILLLIFGFIIYLFIPKNNAVIPTTGTSTTVRARPGTYITNIFNNGSSTNQNTNQNNQQTTPTQTNIVPSLRQISQNPISGYNIFSLGTSSKVIYTDRASGNTYQTNLDEIKLERPTINPIPTVYEANWSNRANLVAMRFLKGNTDTIKTFIGQIATTSTLNSNLTGKFLPDNITQVAINPNGDKIFYLVNGSTDSFGYIATTKITDGQQKFTSPAKEWLVDWPKNDTIIMTTKPSAQALGYVYSLNTNTGAFNKLYGGIVGLTTLFNKDLTKSLYSKSIDNAFTLGYYDAVKNETKTVSFKTLPEKCVWSNVSQGSVYCAIPAKIYSGDYPDIWYQGEVSFEDEIWRIDLDTNKTTRIYNVMSPVNYKGLDAINLKLNPTEKYLTFTDKNSLQLFVLNLTK